MADSISAVAAICASAPPITHGQKAAGVGGRLAPVTAITPNRKISANGNPNRNRTWVAPTVPRLAVSSRCMALRAVCAAAAISVKTAQSIARRKFLSLCRHGAGFARFRPLGHLAALVVDH